MTNVEAAIGVAQLGRIDEFIQKKRYIASSYNSLLKDIPGLTLPVEKPWAKNVYWMYCIVVEDEFGISRDELMARLLERGIETRTMFIPMNQQPAFHKLGLFKAKKTNALWLRNWAEKGLYLPSGVGLTDEQIKYICDTIKDLRRRK